MEGKKMIQMNLLIRLKQTHRRGLPFPFQIIPTQGLNPDLLAVLQMTPPPKQLGKPKVMGYHSQMGSSGSLGLVDMQTTMYTIDNM